MIRPSQRLNAVSPLRDALFVGCFFVTRFELSHSLFFHTIEGCCERGLQVLLERALGRRWTLPSMIHEQKGVCRRLTHELSSYSARSTSNIK